MQWNKLFLMWAILFGLAACSSGVARHSKQSDQSEVGASSRTKQPNDSSGIITDQSVSTCPSTVTLDIVSSNYSGVINIEFRQGKRPGSKTLQTSKINTSGQVKISNVCAGTYFFSFSTPDSPSVSVTQYFDVINNGVQYSSPKITVTYTRAKTRNAVQTVGRGSL